MPLTRQQFANLYRPTGPKAVVSSASAAPGTQQNFVQQIDLSTPIEGLRFRLQGRHVIGTAAMASGKPEGYLNLISRIRVSGTNKRQNGNVTVADIDLATLWVAQHLFQSRAAHFDINGTLVPEPTTPFPAVGANGYMNTAVGTYDYRIVVDLPFYPFGAPVGARVGWLMRNEEWLDSVQIELTFPAVPNGAVEGPLGTGASTTTHTFSAFGSGSGTPTIDIETLPVIMGLDLKDSIIPGVLSRVTQPINTVLQSAGSPVTLLNLQKRPTTRIFAKFGTATQPPAFTTLNDTNVTALGLLVGGDRNVRNLLNVFDHKMDVLRRYGTNPIQGYNVLDFIQSGNPDSAFPGSIGEGTTFQLVASVTGLANAHGIIVQEQILQTPEGSLVA